MSHSAHAGGVIVRRIKVLRGPNVWAYKPVLDIIIDIGKYEELPSDILPGFTERLAEAMPSLWQHRCSPGRPGGFFERLRRGTYLGHILEHVIIELQEQAGMPVTYGKTRGTGQPGVYHVVVEYKDEQAARMCVDLALEFVLKLAERQPLGFDLEERLREIRDVAQKNMLGPSTQAIVDAARRRRIPCFQLDGPGGALVQLGHGCCARRISASETSFTCSIAVDIASDKVLTKDLLHKVGVPVPAGRVVDSADDAWRAAIAIIGPVVVKPLAGRQGQAVSVDLITEEQVRAAFEFARGISEKVIVERYVTGSDYRMLVVNGKMVAAALRRPAQVVGDGLHTVRQLVDKINSDPRRGEGHGAALSRIKLDGACELTLSKQGLDQEHVPELGQVVLLRENSNLSTGGTATDVTDDVHPDNAEIAVLAAKAVGLDVAGVDVVCETISHPLSEQGGAVVEVNSAPGLRMHLYPSEGRSQPVDEAIVDMLFPRGAPARVPLIAITGTNGKTTVARMIAHVYSIQKRYVGLATTDGVYFNGVRRIKGDCSGPRSAEAVLQHPLVEVAVLETARGGILRSGLAWDRSAVSVVLNVANDHLGLDGIDTLEELARVKRVIVEGVDRKGYAVLNAEDPLVAAMASKCPGEVIYFATNGTVPVLARHLAGGGRAAYLHHGRLVLAEGINENSLMKAADIPATHGGLVPFQTLNALAAAAACWGEGVPLETIRLGLRTFQADESSAPGRFNLFNMGRARVVVDYGHNPHALRAMQQAVPAMRTRRAIGVVTVPGDRRDADIREVAAIAANTFDWVIVREDDDTRGRERGEISRLMADTIGEVCPSLPVSVIVDEDEAVVQALEMARADDLVVIFADKVEVVIEMVKHAAQTMAEMEEGAFKVPVAPENSPWAERDRIEAAAYLAAQGIYPQPE